MKATGLHGGWFWFPGVGFWRGVDRRFDGSVPEVLWALFCSPMIAVAVSLTSNPDGKSLSADRLGEFQEDTHLWQGAIGRVFTTRLGWF